MRTKYIFSNINNILSSFLFFCLSNNYGQSIPSFIAPDTVCVNQTFTITNTSSNASTYYWNFCSGNINTPSQATNLGNPGGLLQYPVATQIFKDAGNYCMFIVNNQPGTPNSLVRLNFGNSLSNTPTAINLGNPNNALPGGYICDIKIENENGHYYGIVVGGYANGANGTTTASPRLVTLDFGSSLMNTPTAINLGNLGSWSYPHSLDISQSGGNYYGFVLDCTGNKVSRLDFGNSLSNTPTNTTLSNILNLNGPSRLSIINYQNNWYGYIVNSGVTGNNSITTLNFGNTLVNNPTATTSTTSTSLNQPCSISVFTDCDGLSGLVGTYPQNHLITLNFPSGPTGIIVTSDLGNIANFNNPNSINDGYRVIDTLYVFIPNLYGNSISRLEYLSCNNSSIPSSILQTPPTISYNTPGVYDITLTTDETLISEATACKQVVVIATPTVTVNSASICLGTSATLTAIGASAYNWLPTTGLNTTTSASVVASPTVTTTYTIIGTSCNNNDTVFATVKVISLPVISANSATICSGSSAILTAGGASTYSWSPIIGLSASTGTSVSANPLTTSTYTIVGIDINGCSNFIISTVKINPLPTIMVNSATICSGASAVLTATGVNSYTWTPSSGLNTSMGATVTITPSTTSTYTISGTDINGCKNSTTSILSVVHPLNITVNSSSICIGDSTVLKANGANSYTWIPTTNLRNTSDSTVNVSPIITTTYSVAGIGICGSDTAVSEVVVHSPSASLNSNTLGCQTIEASINGINGKVPFVFTYQINGKMQLPIQSSESSGVANLSQNNVALGSYTYSLVSVKDANNCSSSIINQTSTINVYSKPNAVFTLTPEKATVLKSSIVINNISIGGDSWIWDFGDSSKSFLQNQGSHTYSDTGHYTVKLITISKYGCKDSSYQSVIITPPFVLYIPNTFTPNGDRNNDVFTPKGEGVLTYEITTGLSRANTNEFLSSSTYLCIKNKSCKKQFNTNRS